MGWDARNGSHFELKNIKINVYDFFMGLVPPFVGKSPVSEDPTRSSNVFLRKTF